MPAGTDDPRDVKALAEWLSRHAERCPVCEYALNGLAVCVCPECGSRLRLSVAAPSLTLRPWLLATIGFTLACGFDWVAVVVMSAIMIHEGLPPARSPALSLYAGLFLLGVASLAGLVAMLRGRRRWIRRAHAWQWRRALVIFGATGLLHAAFALWWIPR